jgi:hypothetical protein
VVKTELVSLRSSKELKLLEEYEYTAHSSLVHSFYVPVVKFHYEPSPMQVGIPYYLFFAEVFILSLLNDSFIIRSW